MTLPINADIPLILDRLRPGASWGFLGENKADSTNLDWRDVVQSKPTQQELEDEWTIIETERASKQTIKQQLKTEYQAIEGRPHSDLTNAELRTLIEIHSFIFGGIDEITRNYKPANKWEIIKDILGT